MPLLRRYGVLLALAVLVAVLPLVLPSSYHLRSFRILDAGGWLIEALGDI
jgi:hypothetical protein